MLLKGKTALVAGAGPGLGRDVALLFAEHGANLVLGARRAERTEAVAAEVRAAGGNAEAVVLDVGDATSCHAALDAATAAFGGLDILVNNAFDTGDFARFVDADLDQWRHTMEVNLWGTLQMTRCAVPALRAGSVEAGPDGAGPAGGSVGPAWATPPPRGGRVVMVNSLSSWQNVPAFGAYAISKAALEAATKTLAVELGPDGIRVNGVHPGYIWGDSVLAYVEIQARQRDLTPEQVYAELAAEGCLGYLPPSAEVAGSVLFLASDLAAPVTGQSLGVTAGHDL